MSVVVEPDHGLSQDEVERLVLESVEHAHDDFSTRRFIEYKNKADADLRHTAKAFASYVGQLSATDKANIDAATATLKAAMAGRDPDALHRATDAFGEATRPLAELLMNAAATSMLTGKTESEMTKENTP